MRRSVSVWRMSVKWNIEVVLRRSIQATLYSGTSRLNNASKSMKKTPKLHQIVKGREGKLVVCRGYFLELLGHRKNLRDQLIVELPTLQAYRTGEVSSQRVEWIDFETGRIQVLDSKKNELFTLPLEPVVAEHLAEYIRQMRLTEGILIQPLPNAPHTGRKPGSKTKGEGLSCTQIERRWWHLCEAYGLPRMSPRMGRAYWAVVEHFVLGKPLGYIQWFLRHDDLQSTEHYLSRIVSYEDMEAIFQQGKKSPFKSACTLSDKCPNAVADCYCRGFTPELKVKVEA